MLWINDQRGYLLDWLTQEWVRWTGRQVDLAHENWLIGPMGKTQHIGKDFFSNLASETGLRLRRHVDAGLIEDFGLLTSENVDARVQDFYVHTARYDLDAWAQWVGVFRPFGGLLARLFSRRLQQLNVPLSGLDTSQGITSEILQLVEGDTVRYTAWVRQLISSGNVLYAGSYSLCEIPGYAGICVKVVFPLPNGNAIVLMKPIVHEDGSLTLASVGERFGEPGFYFTVQCANGKQYSKYIRAMRETIHVYSGTGGDVRADHMLMLFGRTFLRLHYRLNRSDASA